MNLYNILFGILLTAGLAVGVNAVGPETLIDEARSFVGMEKETVFVRPPVMTEEAPEAAPVNPASVPAEEPAVAPETTQSVLQGLRIVSVSHHANGSLGVEVFTSPHSLEPMQGWVSNDIPFPEDAYAVYTVHIVILNPTDMPIDFPFDAVNLRFYETGTLSGVPVVAGPYAASAIGEDGFRFDMDSVVIPPFEDVGKETFVIAYFSVPVQEVDPRDTLDMFSKTPPALFFGDIGPGVVNLADGSVLSADCYSALAVWGSAAEACDY